MDPNLLFMKCLKTAVIDILPRHMILKRLRVDFNLGIHISTVAIFAHFFFEQV